MRWFSIRRTFNWADPLKPLRTSYCLSEKCSLQKSNQMGTHKKWKGKERKEEADWVTALQRTTAPLMSAQLNLEHTQTIALVRTEKRLLFNEHNQKQQKHTMVPHTWAKRCSGVHLKWREIKDENSFKVAIEWLNCSTTEASSPLKATKKKRQKFFNVVVAPITQSRDKCVSSA